MHVREVVRYLQVATLAGLLTVACAAQEWSSEGYRELAGTYAEWHAGIVDAKGGGRVLHLRLWLAGPDEWALWSDHYPVNWTGDPSQRSVGWHDCGVQEGVYWDADSEALRCRPLASVRRNLSSRDRDPALAGALLQLGHFLWGGGHLAVVLGESVAVAEDTSLRTSMGCTIELAPASLTIRDNPAVPEQAGVTYTYADRFDAGEAFWPCWSSVRVDSPSEPGVEREMELVDVCRLEEAVPMPRMVAIDGYTYRLEYERQDAAPREYIDTTGSSRFLAVHEAQGVWHEARIPSTWRRWLSLSLLVAVSLLIGVLARRKG